MTEWLIFEFFVKKNLHVLLQISFILSQATQVELTQENDLAPLSPVTNYMSFVFDQTT